MKEGERLESQKYSVQASSLHSFKTASFAQDASSNTKQGDGIVAKTTSRICVILTSPQTVMLDQSPHAMQDQESQAVS